MILASPCQGGAGKIEPFLVSFESDDMVTKEKQTEVKRTAEHLLARGPDWITFYREILGPRGIIRRLFPTREALEAFEQSETFNEILNQLTKLRERAAAEEGEKRQPGEHTKKEEEPTKVITVRLPKSMHESLWLEAHERRTSMNKLCISKLLQFIDSDKVPAEKQELEGK